MPQIGEFTRQKSGFFGRIRTLTLDSEIAIVVVDTAGVETRPITVFTSARMKAAPRSAPPGRAPARRPETISRC